MEPTHNKRRLTITLDNSIFDRLPKRDRSSFINQVLKQYYQLEAFEQFYDKFKKKLINDKEWAEYLELTIREVR